MANTVSELKQTLTPALLDEVRDFWFSHFPNEDALILPGMNEMMKWFKKDEEFDNACVAQFQPALESILASGASATDILDSFDSKSPLTWLSLIILLDQVPRNCYRGDKSKLVFERFDPLAQEIALRGIESGVPTLSSHMRYRLAYRFWFHLPLMHSESLAIHEQAIKVHEDTAKDMEDLLQRDIATLDEDEKMCYNFLSGQKDALSGYLSNGLDFEKRHKVIIERFGRYPHRNSAMGREPTKEEIDYLENGGETFG
ncbi:Tetratricopeptide-like helical [Penicillium manginii]|uniref:Tetratricopeptide-like helical n=1 Tax=Penicillium manginii TaxID=203109 RepID=UPI0025466EBC|nr:Tetratricopeptide-like helical [Penicillium manginii]KAJ5763308.1 Tetratricopeptide-like helical [Penicillium manginii]